MVGMAGKGAISLSSYFRWQNIENVLLHSDICAGFTKFTYKIFPEEKKMIIMVNICKRNANQHRTLSLEKE